LGITYDLATGQPLDWAAAIPAWSLVALTGTERGLWSSTTLAQWFDARVFDNPEQDPTFVADCRARYQPSAYGALKFKLWLDAELDALMVMAVLPETVGNCFTYIYVTDDELGAVGLDREVVAALHAAHEAQNWDNGSTRPGGALAAMPD